MYYISDLLLLFFGGFLDDSLDDYLMSVGLKSPVFKI